MRRDAWGVVGLKHESQRVPGRMKQKNSSSVSHNCSWLLVGSQQATWLGHWPSGLCKRAAAPAQEGKQYYLHSPASKPPATSHQPQAPVLAPSHGWRRKTWERQDGSGHASCAQLWQMAAPGQPSSQAHLGRWPICSASGAVAASNVLVSGPCGVMHKCILAPPAEGRRAPPPVQLRNEGWRCTAMHRCMQALSVGVNADLAPGSSALAEQQRCTVHHSTAQHGQRTRQEAVCLGIVLPPHQTHELRHQVAAHWEGGNRSREVRAQHETDSLAPWRRAHEVRHQVAAHWEVGADCSATGGAGKQLHMHAHGPRKPGCKLHPTLQTAAHIHTPVVVGRAERVLSHRPAGREDDEIRHGGA